MDGFKGNQDVELTEFGVRTSLGSARNNEIGDIIKVSNLGKPFITPSVPGTAVAQWFVCRPTKQRAPVQFPVRARAWVAGQVPRWGYVKGNRSKFLSFSSPLPTNKQNLKQKTTYLKKKKKNTGVIL